MEPIRNIEQLRAIVGEPSELTAKKIFPHLNEQASGFIARSPFLALATVDVDGMPTVSPKGDVPGFVHQEDANTLYIPERKGNRLVFSFQNIMATSKVGLIFMVPRCTETLRVSGTVELVADADLATPDAQGNAALLHLKVTVTEAYFHCGKAFIRSGLWDPESWPEDTSKVSFGKEIGDKTGKDQAFVKQVDENVVKSYRSNL